MTDTTDTVATETTEAAVAKKISKTRTSITISPDVFEAAKKRAELDNVSVSSLIEAALKVALA